jgi:hypothetical protein
MSEGASPRANEPRSFTRFVLPFGYSLQRHSDAVRAEDSVPRFVAAEPPLQERKLYLTGETRQVLFERALWLQLNGKDVGFDFRWNVPSEIGLPMSLHRNPPRLVLFEREAAREKDPLKVGFLILDIEVKEEIGPDNLDRLLHFNELFRYFAEPFAGHAARRDLAVSIREYLAGAESAGETLGCCTERLYGGRWESFFKFPLQIGNQTYGLDATIRRTDGDSKTAIHPDNRAFVWTAAVVAGGAGALKERWGGDLRKPEEFGQWIHLLNVDFPCSWPTRTHEARTDFETAWAHKRTYYRWAEWGSWYGFCYHGGAAILPPETDPPLCQHWSGIYFDQVLLLLYVRTAAFAFSSRLSAISEEAREGGNGSREWLGQFAELRWQFTLFTNLYRFPLLSNQQQGLEMYVLARKRMDADELFEEVDKEIRNCDEYLASYTQSKQARASTVLNLVAMVGLVLGLGLALVQAGLRMPFVRVVEKNPDKWPSFIWGALLTILFGALAVVFWRPLQTATEHLMGWLSAGKPKKGGYR